MSEDLFCEENDLECGFGQEEDEAMIEHEDDEMESDQIANILKCKCGAKFDGFETVCKNCGQKRPYGSVGRPPPITPRTEALINRARQDEAMLDAPRGEINEVAAAAGADGRAMAAAMAVQEHRAVGRRELDTKIGMLPRAPHYLEGGPPPPKIGDGRRLGVKMHKGVGPKPMKEKKYPFPKKGGRRTRKKRRRRRQRGSGWLNTIKHRLFGTPLPTEAEREQGEIRRMGKKHEITAREGREIKRLMRKDRFERGPGLGRVEHLPAPMPKLPPPQPKQYIATGLRRRKGRTQRSETYKKMVADEEERQRKTVARRVEQIEARERARRDRKRADAELVGNLSKSFRSTETSVRSYPPDYEGELVNIREPYSSNPLVSKVLEKYKLKIGYPPMISLSDTIEAIFEDWWSVACATAGEKECFKRLAEEIKELEIAALNFPGDINVNAIKHAREPDAFPINFMVKNRVREKGLKLYPLYLDAFNQIKRFKRGFFNEQQENMEILGNELLALESFVINAEFQRELDRDREGSALASALPGIYNRNGGRKTRRKKRKRRRRTLKGGYKGPSKRGLDFKATRVGSNGVLNISQLGINWIIDGKPAPKIPWQWYRILKVKLSDNALHIEVGSKQAFEQGQMGGYYIYRLTDQDKAEELLRLVAYASPKTKIEADHPAEPPI